MHPYKVTWGWGGGKYVGLFFAQNAPATNVGGETASLSACTGNSVLLPYCKKLQFSSES